MKRVMSKGSPVRKRVTGVEWAAKALLPADGQPRVGKRLRVVEERVQCTVLHDLRDTGALPNIMTESL